MDNREQSEFNNSVGYINRINTLFWVADETSTNLDINTWYHILLALFRELSTEMKDEEIEETTRKFEKINEELQKHLKESQRKGVASIPPTLYLSLHTTEMKLRRIGKESGLQQKMKEDWLSPDEEW